MVVFRQETKRTCIKLELKANHLVSCSHNKYNNYSIIIAITITIIIAAIGIIVVIVVICQVYAAHILVGL